MLRVEERIAIVLRRIGQESLEEELVNQPRGTIAHRCRHLQKGVQVIVHNHLAREREHLGIGVELILGHLFNHPTVLNLTVGRKRHEVPNIRQTEAVSLLEVRQVTLRAKARCDNRLSAEGLQQLLVGHIRENARQTHRREGRANRLVAKGTADALTFQAEALSKHHRQRHITVLTRDFARLFTIGLEDFRFFDAGAQTECRLKALGRSARGLLDNDIRGRNRALGAECLKHLRGCRFKRPPSANGFTLNLRALPSTDGANGHHAFTLGLGRLRLHIGHFRLGRGLRCFHWMFSC